MEELSGENVSTPSSADVGGGGDSNDVVEQSKLVKRMDKFGWALTALTGVMAGLNGIYAINVNNPFPHNSAAFVYLLVLHWSVCLDERSSLRSLRFTFFLGYLGFQILPSITVPYWHDRVERLGSEVFVRDIVFGVMFAVLFIAMYRTFTVSRRAVQKQYGKKTINASVKIATQFASASPYIIFIVMNLIGSESSVVHEAEMYASHTPFCKYTPDELSRYNIEYQCETTWNWERGDHMFAHNGDGISNMPVFTSPTAFLNLTESVKAAKIFEDRTTTNTTVFLTYNDFVRIFAVHKYLIAFQAYMVYTIQGLVFVFVLFVAQIFSRVTWVSYDDVLAFNISKLETFIVLNTFAMGLLSMYISSLNGKSLSEQILLLLFFLALLILTLFIALYILCKKVIMDKSKKVLQRHPRPTAPAQKIHPSPTQTPESDSDENFLELKKTVKAQERKIKEMEEKAREMSQRVSKQERKFEEVLSKLNQLTSP